MPLDIFKILIPKATIVQPTKHKDKKVKNNAIKGCSVTIKKIAKYVDSL